MSKNAIKLFSEGHNYFLEIFENESKLHKEYTKLLNVSIWKFPVFALYHTPFYQQLTADL